MNRADAASFVGDHLGAYLTAVSRDATDTAGDLEAIINDAFRALGYIAADIPTATTDGEEADEDLRVQVTYRALLQIVRDLGATYFDVTVGDSFKLSQVRAAAEKDLALAEAAVLERFGTTGVAPSDSANPFVTLDLNFLTDDCREEVA